MQSRLFYILLTIALFYTPMSGQQYPLRYSVIPKEAAVTAGASLPISNSITDLVVKGDTIWLGTGKGLSRSVDRGATWKQYYQTTEFGEEDVSAIAVHKNEVWVATAHSVKRDDQYLPEGSGLHFSSDGGETWRSISQPRDAYNIDTLKYFDSKSIIRALGITTTINNITYDIAATDSAIWITSFAGMVRKSTDKGFNWKPVIIPPDNLDKISPADSLVFDLSPSSGALGLRENLNHRAFSVFAENNSNIWIGTAGGINKSTDGGRSWIKYSHQNQLSPISGNFVVALCGQQSGLKKYIWAATVNANDPNEKRGISFSDDGGQSWKTALLGEFIHNIGAKDAVVYAVSDYGIFRTSDEGMTWARAGAIYDPFSRQTVRSAVFYSIGVVGDSVWFGGNDGIAITKDTPSSQFGLSWKVLRAYYPVGTLRKTYAYPNPFSPDDEAVRLHYSTPKSSARVTIHIFDFGMNLVRTVIENATRTGSGEHDEIWDGKDYNMNQIANGTYFYQVAIDNDEPMWGKILVIQ
jgi:ligand-binding sensor domain-containing protein